MHAREHAASAQRRAEEAMAAQVEAEKQYIALQSEHARLHELLQAMQLDQPRRWRARCALRTCALSLRCSSLSGLRGWQSR